MRIATVSPSSFNVYDSCEWKWYLSYILKLSDGDSPSALVGTIAHKVMEIHSVASIKKYKKPSKLWDIDRLWRYSQELHYRLSPAAAAQIKTPYVNKVIDGMRNLYSGPYTPIRDNTMSAEAMFKIAIEDNKLAFSKIKDGPLEYPQAIGKIDRVDILSPDTIEVIDYKTGKREDFGTGNRDKKTVADMYEDIQPRMYHWAMSKMYPQYSTVIVTMIYLTDGGPHTIVFDRSNIEETEEIVKNHILTIKKNYDPQRTLTWRCNKFCGYGKSGTCDKIWRDKEFYGFDFVEMPEYLEPFPKKEYRK